MKKLLGLMTALTLSVAPISTVIACGTETKGDSTKEVGSGILDGIASEILSNEHISSYFDEALGGREKAVETFMNYFAESFMKNADDLLKEDKDKNQSNYMMDDLKEKISDKWTSVQNQAEEAWSSRIKSAKDSYGKKWEKKLKEEFEKEFGEHKNKTNYKDFKNDFISKQIISGNTGGSLIEQLKGEIYNYSKTKSSKEISTTLTEFRSEFANGSKKIGETTIDFSKNNKTVKGDDFEDAQQKALGIDGNWISEMKKLLTAFSKFNKEEIEHYSREIDIFINLINATGGKTPETFMKDVHSAINVNKIKYLTKNDFVNFVSQDIDKLAINLIWRMDSNFYKDFSNNPSKDTSSIDMLTSLNGLNREEGETSSDGFKLFSKLLENSIDMASTESGNTIKGLFSNSQRFFANDYYKTEKPLAISEIVIGNLYDPIKEYDKQITNSGYIGKDSNNMSNLIDFMNLFVNSDMKHSDSEAESYDEVLDSTKTPYQGESEYSWDRLLSLGVDKLKDITANDRDINWHDGFTSKASIKEHNNLLTLDSKDSEYSNLLKYSIYDFLLKENKQKQYDFATKTEDTKLNDFKLSDLGNPDMKDDAEKINSFVHSMDRTIPSNKTKEENDAENNIYQVVNEEQGIISFIDKDGIHFVRIEGYKILQDQDNLLSKQGYYSKDNENEKMRDSQLNEAQSFQLLNNYFNSKNVDSLQKANARSIVTDYMNQTKNDNEETDIQKNTGLNYSDFNQEFGNQYLRFLANSSILKINNVEGSKYSYDLDSEVQNYISSTSPGEDSTSSSMWLATWEYAKQILGIKKDSDMFEKLFNDGNSRLNNYFFKNIIGSAKEVNEVKEKYKEYIISAIPIFISNRNDSYKYRFSENWKNWNKELNSVDIDDSIEGLDPVNTLGDNAYIDNINAKMIDSNLFKYEIVKNDEMTDQVIKKLNKLEIFDMKVLSIQKGSVK